MLPPSPGASSMIVGPVSILPVSMLPPPPASITKVDCPNSLGKSMDDEVVVAVVVVVVAFSAVISYLNVSANNFKMMG